jgi:predicted CXXCH cytochrome family protein
MSLESPQLTQEPRRPIWLRAAALLLAGIALAVVAWRLVPASWFRTDSDAPPPLPAAVDPPDPPRQLAAGRHLTVWWDTLPPRLRLMTESTGPESNIHPADYAGPDSCKTCHPVNYQLWAQHPHRWMNALADNTTVKGDFSTGRSIVYQGGRASFFHGDNGYFMRLERGTTHRLYVVTQTIGSRYFQYYVGKQIEGPEPAEHHFYHKDHVLPFGYWLDEKEWVPTVHIGPESRDGERPDPFDPPASGQHYAEYAASCNYCHTTFPLGDLLGRRPQQMGQHAPRDLHWSVRKYLAAARPAEMQAIAEHPPRDGESNPMASWDAPHYAVTLGVSCEACHLGSKQHADSRGRVKPEFFPRSPALFVQMQGGELDFGRTHDNVNWSCGRCHTGDRPTFAAGMSTWNSVEYSDAMRGSCYSQARCVDCHDPHRAIGPRWTMTADQDDAQCLKCHGKFEPATERTRHTHHPMGSEGARCMNCHMPRINEGLQDVVRTHMIYSPTRADMIEANHPNACNLCHTNRPIDWTLSYLKEWYGKRFKEQRIVDSYPDRAEPVARGWLNSDNESVRLIGADAMVRARDPEAVPQLLGALDDPFLLNRQFAMRRLQELLRVRLADFGYHFYMTPAERRKPLAELRQKYASANRPKTP